MRVDLTTYGLEPPDKGQDKAKVSRTSLSEQGSNSVAADQAKFTFDQARVSALEMKVMAQPEVRDQKVELLRQAVGKGQYAVQDSQIADSVLADVQGAWAH